MITGKHSIVGLLAVAGISIAAFSYCGGDPVDEATTTSSQESAGKTVESIPPTPEGTLSPTAHAAPAVDAAVPPHARLAPAFQPIIPEPPCTSCPPKIGPPGEANAR